ncbi:hypothetical protein OAI82_02595 [bacterium]|nr:hypothetical protein [bacterium]
MLVYLHSPRYKAKLLNKYTFNNINIMEFLRKDASKNKSGIRNSFLIKKLRMKANRIEPESIASR